MSESEEEPPKERQAQSHWQQDGDGADGFDVCDVKYDFIMHSTEWIIGLAMWSCILISIALHWDDTTQTHCGVSNWLPSMSAAIGNNFPQRMIWRGAIALTLYQRLYDSVLYFRYHAFYFSKRQHVAVAAASPSAADGCSPAVARMVHVAPASAYGTSSVNSASTQSYPLHCQPCDGSTGAAGGSSTVFSCNSGPTANRRARGAKDANVNTSEDVRLGVVSRAPIMNPTLSSGGTRLPFALNLLHTCFLVGENLSLALLTYVSSTESHALHELGTSICMVQARIKEGSGRMWSRLLNMHARTLSRFCDVPPVCHRGDAPAHRNLCLAPPLAHARALLLATPGMVLRTQVRLLRRTGPRIFSIGSTATATSSVRSLHH